MEGVRRVGKRIVLALEGELFLALHLMIAGGSTGRSRARSCPGGSGSPRSTSPTGTLVLTEAGTKRRAALHLVHGRGALAALDRGGLEPLGATSPRSGRRSRARTTP